MKELQRIDLWGVISRPIVRLLVLLIEGYRRWISPAMRPCCRFVPSCSSYAAQSLEKFGLIKGLVKIVWRLARCHPLCKGGYDPP